MTCLDRQREAKSGPVDSEGNQAAQWILSDSSLERLPKLLTQVFPVPDHCIQTEDYAFHLPYLSETRVLNL